MINNIYGNSQWLNIQTYASNKPYMNTTQAAAGMVRWNNNTNGGCLEVYDGQNWQQIDNGAANIDLNDHVKEILTWAEKKMHEERKLTELMDRHPGLKELNDKFEMMRTLCMEEENTQ